MVIDFKLANILDQIQMPTYFLRKNFEGIYSTTVSSTTTTTTTSTTTSNVLEEVLPPTQTMENLTKFQFDPSEDVPVQQILSEEILKQVNHLVKQDAIRQQQEARQEAVAVETEPLFGQIETDAKNIVESLVSDVQKASAGEIITLVVGIIVILYWVNRAMGHLFRYSLKVNYRMREENNGVPGWKRTTWQIVEQALEKFWMPLWCSGDVIRREAYAECLDEDLERAQDRLNGFRTAEILVPTLVDTPLAPPISINNENNEANRHRGYMRIIFN
jgi:hypothetical protein